MTSSKIFPIISLLCLASLFYGIFFTIIEEEKNACRMTYMFEYPQFVKINFLENQHFPKYGLYAYSEGALIERTRAMQFNGAPVIFVPGNSGSYKQVRSLASVAIRKGIDNEWRQHLNYFTIDFNEEYSALFGGYLENQKLYLKLSINTVLNLYKRLKNPPKQVILIGHSMGGKIAESLLADPDVELYINTIISIASPLDKPAINIDSYFNQFYSNMNKLLESHRTITTDKYPKNVCQHWETHTSNENNSLPLDNKLLISIGGGSRDILVDSALTISKSYDINVLTTSIPNVWLTTDHLCSVWCLQLVLIVNRFLHSIISLNNRNYKQGQFFIEDKAIRLSRAYNYFVHPDIYNYKSREIVIASNISETDWIEDSRRVYSIVNEERNKTNIYMIRLVDLPSHKYLAAMAVNNENNDWIFGCAASEVSNNMRFCSKAISLTNFAEKFPSHSVKKSVALLDLHKLKQNNSSWTHVLLKSMSMKQIGSGFNIDIFDPIQRFIQISTPKWYSFNLNTAVDETLTGSSFYKLEITGLEESYQTLAIYIKPRICSKEFHHSIAKVCIPWTKGCEKYQHFTNTNNHPLYLTLPYTNPKLDNTENNTIAVYIHLDPNCRYKITYQNCFGATMSQIVRKYIHWIPAHLVSILLMAFKHQITITPAGNFEFKNGKLHVALLSSTSFFVVTTSRIFAMLFMKMKHFPPPENFNHSIIISVIIHGSAFTLILISTACLWLLIYIYGNMAHKILLKIIKLPIPTITDSVMPLIEKFPISAGVLLISIANASCGGIALVCGCLIYFMMITKQYEDYLEEFVFHTAKLIAAKLFGKTKKDEQKPDEKDSERINELNTMNAAITSKSEILLNTLESSKDTDFPDDISDEELNKLLEEAIAKQTKLMEEKKNREKLLQAEYNSVHESFSSINFHMTLFLFLCILTLLNLPSTISWAKNFSYNQRLSPDPSLFTACISLFCISILWQFSAPRNVKGYKILSYVVYICSACCIIFCQDSVYRLNYIISFIFVAITLHQILSPKKLIADETESTNNELEEQIEKIKTLLNEES